jgi:hypothetical protein
LQERERSVAEQYSQTSARLAALEAQAAKAGDLRYQTAQLFIFQGFFNFRFSRVFSNREKSVFYSTVF